MLAEPQAVQTREKAPLAASITHCDDTYDPKPHVW